MLRFDHISLRRGPLLLLEDMNLSVHAGWRVGISGRNGAGKSSLLALVAGELSPDAGSFERPAGWSLAWVRQEMRALESTAVDHVLDGDAEFRAIEHALADAEAAHAGDRIAALHERMHAIGGYAARARAGELLHGLGFARGDENRRVDEFSGGWRMRLHLARALMCRSDLLLLDEPTNHLDLDTVLWLQGWLQRYRGTLLLISHDREFLDAIVTHVLAIENRQVDLFSGDLSVYERKRAERLVQQRVEYAKQQREREHLQSFVDRFRAKASKARQAQSRVKALERMVDIAPLRAASPITFTFRVPAALPMPLIKLSEVAAGYGERQVLASVELVLAPGDRIALLGANGAGKSTLIKLLAGVAAPVAGERIVAKDLVVGYFAQHQLEQLDVDATPVDHLLRLDRNVAAKEARDFLGGFGFSGDRALTAVGPFSGGEKARLCLALTVYRRPNLLLLDEPTNHLDLDMREALAEALNDFAGALVLVAHDRALIRACCDTLLHVGSGRVTDYAGDLDDYTHQVLREPAAQTTEGVVGTGSRREERRARAASRARVAPLRQRLQALEKRIAELDADKSAAEAELADPALYDGLQDVRVQALSRRSMAIGAEVAELETQWLETQSQLEQPDAD
jgi:ATP-binding cassette, subfamily F, member 3